PLLARRSNDAIADRPAVHVTGGRIAADHPIIAAAWRIAAADRGRRRPDQLRIMADVTPPAGPADAGEDARHEIAPLADPQLDHLRGRVVGRDIREILTDVRAC